jgi:hypothetical protein
MPWARLATGAKLRSLAAANRAAAMARSSGLERFRAEGLRHLIAWRDIVDPDAWQAIRKSMMPADHWRSFTARRFCGPHGRTT